MTEDRAKPDSVSAVPSDDRLEESTATQKGARGRAQHQDESFTVLRRRLSKFFALTQTDLVIGFLILISVSLTMAELSLPDTAENLPWIRDVNYAITVVFAAELTLRFVAESVQEGFVRRYFRRWWIDLLAVFPTLLFPLFQALRIVRGLQILRFLRVLRVARLYRAFTNFLPYMVRKGAIHLSLILLTIFASIAVGTALIISFERSDDFSFGDAFWFSLYSLFAGEPVPGPPVTIGGRVASIAILFMGLVVFAAFVGTVSAYMIERLQKESRGMGKGDLYENHVILCGLGTVGYRIVQTLRRMDEEVVVIDNDEESEFHDLARASKAQVVVDDVKRKGALKEAGIARAKAVIACTSDDLTNLEIALDARSERPDVRVVLRMFDQRLAEKIAEGFNIQVALSVSALSAPAFAAAAIDRSVKGSLEVGDRLYIHSEFVVPPTSALTEMTVDDLKTRFGVHTLAIWDGDGPGNSEPGVDAAIPGGATVSVVGPYDRIAELKEAFGVTQDLVKAASKPKSLLTDS